MQIGFSKGQIRIDTSILKGSGQQCCVYHVPDNVVDLEDLEGVVVPTAALPTQAHPGKRTCKDEKTTLYYKL